MIINNLSSAINFFLCLVFSLVSLNLSAQKTTFFPDYISDMYIDSLLLQISHNKDITYIVYQPDLVRIYNLKDNDRLTGEEMGKNTFSMVLVRDLKPNVLFFLGDTLLCTFYDKSILSLINSLSISDAVWVDSKESDIKVIVPWMFPYGCDIVIFNQNGIMNYFQMPTDTEHIINICTDLDERKYPKRRMLIQRLEKTWETIMKNNDVIMNFPVLSP